MSVKMKHTNKNFQKAKREAKMYILGFMKSYCTYTILGLGCILIFTTSFSQENSALRQERILVSGIDICEEDAILVLPYLIGLLYSFVGVAIVCDMYFEPALTEISERLALSEDVAGATFMAAGSSAPELFTSMLDSFGPSNSIGIGTIVGSAMFNILIIIALSAAVTKSAVNLDWRPIIRDGIFYLTSILLLVFFVIFSGNYCLMPEGHEEVLRNGTLDDLLSNFFTEVLVADFTTEDEIILMLSVNPQVNEVFTSQFVSQHCHFGAVGLEAGVVFVTGYLSYIVFMVFNERIFSRCSGRTSAKVENDPGQEKVVVEDSSDVSEEDNGIFEIPESTIGKAVWLINIPLNVIFALTIPNCEKEKLKKYYLVSFTMCILWMVTLSYVMVTLASRAGCLMGIDSVVMGITVLAAGTSVPDALASMLVARKGMADMAIANAVGSNVFDILLGLGIPWALAQLVLGKKSYVERNKVAEYIFILLGTLLLYVSSIIVNSWRMTKELGYIYVFIYCLFLLYILLTEL